jgi:hypothetical protein
VSTLGSNSQILRPPAETKGTEQGLDIDIQSPERTQKAPQFPTLAIFHDPSPPALPVRSGMYSPHSS